jgi:hypothetical protein
MFRPLGAVSHNDDKYAFLASRFATVYECASGNPLTAALIPTVGYLFHRTGEDRGDPMLKEMGKAIAVGAILAMPGAATSYAITAMGGPTLAIKAVAVLVGTAIAYKATNDFANFVVRGMMAGLR